MPLDELRTALRQAVELDEPAVGDGPAVVFAQADRAQARHRLTMSISAVAVLAVAIGVATLAVGRSGAPLTAGDEPGAPAAALSNPVASSSHPISKQVTPTPSQQYRAVPADVMLATLRRLLPASMTTSQPASQPEYAHLVLTDSAGSGVVEINVQANFNVVVRDPDRPAGSDKMDLFSCAKRHDPAGTHCTQSTQPDSTLVVLTDGPSEDAGHDRIKRRQADVYRPDGVRIVISTWNAVHEKTNIANRAEPPLTSQQLLAIATDPAWRV